MRSLFTQVHVNSSNDWFSSFISIKLYISFFSFLCVLGESLALPWRRPNRSSKPAVLGLARKRSSTKINIWQSTMQVGKSTTYWDRLNISKTEVDVTSQFRLQSSLSKKFHHMRSSACKNFKNPLPSIIMLVICQIFYRAILYRKKMLFGNSTLWNSKNPVH